jgi:hypothetical protein
MFSFRQAYARLHSRGSALLFPFIAFSPAAGIIDPEA